MSGYFCKPYLDEETKMSGGITGSDKKPCTKFNEEMSSKGSDMKDLDLKIEKALLLVEYYTPEGVSEECVRLDKAREAIKKLFSEVGGNSTDLEKRNSFLL